MTPPAADPPGGDRGAAEYGTTLAVLWKWKSIIVVSSFVVVLIVVVVTLLLPRTYGASALLIVASSSLADAGATAPRLPISAETFANIISSPSIAAEAIRRFQLDRTPHRLTPERFLVDAIAVRPVSGTSLVRVTVTLRDAELAAGTANFLAESAIQLNARATQSDAAATRDYIMRQRDQAAAALDAAQAALRDFKREANLDAVRADLRILLEDKDRLEKLAGSTAIEQVGLLAQIREWSAALSQQQQLLTLRKSIVTDPAAMAAARQRGVEDKDLAGVQLENQEINVVHQSLRQQLINAQAALASFEAQRRDTERKIEENGRKIAKTSALVTALEARLDELNHLYSLAKATHALMAKKLDEAELSVAARATDLKLVERASVPTEPRDRGLPVKATIAGATALAAFSALALWIEAARRARAEAPRS
jgi:capsular polysaccharide biosynthesis protein